MNCRDLCKKIYNKSTNKVDSDIEDNYINNNVESSIESSIEEDMEDNVVMEDNEDMEYNVVMEDNEVMDIYSYLIKYNVFNNYSVHYLTKIDNTIVGIIYYKKNRSHINYMDSDIRKFTKILSNDFKDISGKNVFYDIDRGVITIQI